VSSAKIIEVDTGAEDEEKAQNYSPSFKAKVALAVLRGDKTMPELAEQFDASEPDPGVAAQACLTRQASYLIGVASHPGMQSASSRNCMPRSVS